jgi:hypothetical protein
MKEHVAALVNFIGDTFSDPEYDGVPLIKDVVDNASHFMSLLPENTPIP